MAIRLRARPTRLSPAAWPRSPARSRSACSTIWSSPANAAPASAKWGFYEEGALASRSAIHFLRHRGCPAIPPQILGADANRVGAEIGGRRRIGKVDQVLFALPVGRADALVQGRAIIGKQ